MKWIKDLSEPKTMGYYFIKVLDIEDGEISKDVAEFIPGFAWPVPDGCEVVEWLDESQQDNVGVSDAIEYQIDFGNHLRSGVIVKGNKIKIIGAMNGWGDKVPSDDIKVTEVNKSESQPLKEEFDVNKQANIISLASGMFRSEPQEQVNEDELWNDVMLESEASISYHDFFKRCKNKFSITRK